MTKFISVHLPPEQSYKMRKLRVMFDSSGSLWWNSTSPKKQRKMSAFFRLFPKDEKCLGCF